MSDNKRYYWIKLKQNFFDLEAIDWLQSQTNGCEYIVLYQKLCLIAANKDGQLFTRIGEMLIPYDANKIARDTKFNVDTVVVAMELFKRLGLIYQQENGVISIPYVDEIIGSECDSAQRVRKHRAERALQCNNNVTNETLQCNVEYRDKRIEYRDIDNKSIDNINICAEAQTPLSEKSKSSRFIPPTIDDIKAYCKETGKLIDTEAFINYYQSNGWKVGRNAMKDWKAAVRNWYQRDYGNKAQSKETSYNMVEVEAKALEKYKNL